MHKEYQTQNLILRSIDKTYTEQVLDYYFRNKDYLKEWEPIKHEEFYTRSFQEDQIERELDLINNGTSLRLWIFKINDENRIIGSVAFNNIVRGAFQSCHLGYKLDKDEINKGYMTEAIQKGLEIIFSEFKLHRIEANIMPRNVSSLKVVEKLGFYNEGLAYKYLKINGNWEDHIHMVLLNDDKD